MNHPPQPVRQILATLRHARSVCVVGHVRPDGDCIGSQLALALALRDQGKKVSCWNEDKIPKKLAFLDRDRLFKTPKPGAHFDCVVATDSASFERLGKIGPLILDRRTFINIDHHSSNTRYADINWVSPHEPSTGELIFHLLKTARWPITPPIADSLFTAVSTDTGSFQYPTTLPETYLVAAELVRSGANLAKVCDEVYQSYPIPRVRLLQHVYNSFKLSDHNRIAYFWLKRADYTRTGAHHDDSEGLIDHIRAIEPVVVACMFEEISPKLARVSFRSKNPLVDVNHIASSFGGGGHAAAAGARIQGTFKVVERQVLAAVRRMLEKNRLIR